MKDSYQGKRFDREQLVFIVEVALVSALDRIESGMPTSGIDWKERLHYANGIDKDAKSLTSWDRSAMETAGMALGVLYAQLTDDGLGIGDALACAGRFDKAVEEWVELTWADEGKAVYTRLQSFGRDGYQIKDAYTNYPDCNKHAEAFVDEVFKEYLAENPMTMRDDITTAEQARDHAVEWQHWAAEQNLSYGEVAEWQAHFEQLATKFGLTEEFKENGII